MPRPLQHFQLQVTFIFANGAAGATLIQQKPLLGRGEILHIRQIDGSNTNAVTAKLELITRQALSFFDGTAKNHNGGYDHEFVTSRRIIDGQTYLQCTISGDPGATGYKVDAIIDVFGREG
jgi:hypothetical protein